MNTIHKAICTALGFAAAFPSAVLAGDKKSQKASIERQELIISLREQMEKELGFTLELTRDGQGLDSLSINTSNLPANGGMYSIYVCWLDEPAAPGGWPLEKRMEQGWRIRGTGRHPTKNGASSVSSNRKSSITIHLNAPHTNLGDYYGRGRVCAMAVSNKGVYVSNIVIVPEKPEEAVKPHAEELRPGEDKPGIVPDTTNAGERK